MNEPKVWTISIRAAPILFPAGEVDVCAQTYACNYEADPENFCAKPEDFAYFVEHSAFLALQAKLDQNQSNTLKSVTPLSLCMTTLKCWKLR